MLADATISRNIIDFADTLRHRFNQELAACEELQIRSDMRTVNTEEDFGADMITEGEHMGIRRCIDILTELVNAEVEVGLQRVLKI